MVGVRFSHPLFKKIAKSLRNGGFTDLIYYRKLRGNQKGNQTNVWLLFFCKKSFLCLFLFIKQRSAGCPERRFLTGRRVGWASGRLGNRSYPATYFIVASLRPSYLSLDKSLSRNSDTSSISSLSIKSSFISTSRSV